MRRISMATRDELLEALSARYRGASRAEKGRILTEFAEISGYHRKHVGEGRFGWISSELAEITAVTILPFGI